MLRKVMLVLGPALAFFVAACNPVLLNQESTFEVTPGQTYELRVDPVSRAQKIKIQATATGGPINVYVYSEKDAEAARKLIRSRNLGSPVLGYHEKTENASVEADVPANLTAVIMFELASAKKVTVNAKITN